MIATLCLTRTAEFLVEILTQFFVLLLTIILVYNNKNEFLVLV